ncbi:hypothetical protein EDD17DRAFT_589292 [Pisolithus thermaeus]|nr:hypothetical protein EDD17DRAFT_589292 [Pisolithus thermaeus]
MALDINIRDLFGSSPSANSIANFLKGINLQASALTPEVKTYPDMVYFNYHKLGVSLQFAPRGGYKPKAGLVRDQLKDDCLSLEGIDIYNGSKPQSGDARAEASSQSAQSAFSPCPLLPLRLPRVASAHGEDSTQSYISIAANTTGKEFVSWLGEPCRKGGGTGPSSGSINIWCEWSREGIMVEFGGTEARGPQAWEKGKDAVWRVVTVFLPTKD